MKSSDLYTTEVQRLAGELGIPEFVVGKPSTAGFWIGQTDEADLGASYAVIDEVLRRLEAGHDTILAVTDASPETISTVRAHHEGTRHERHRPPIADLSSRPGPRG